MKLVAKLGRDDLAIVYIAEDERGRRIEFVESVQPPFAREEKWVNIVSTLFGCPVKCKICDAGERYQGKLSADDLFYQLDYLVKNRFGGNKIESDYWKIQFARMGEPAFNMAVLDVIEALPERYVYKKLIPSLSTVAPNGTDKFFERLLEIKHKRYRDTFQFQFSLHTTDPKYRRELLPVKCWDFERMAEYGKEIFGGSGRKVTLNFALAKEIPFSPDELLKNFDPDVFLVKLTPLNPTYQVVENGLTSSYENKAEVNLLTDQLNSNGYDVIQSYGEGEENAIGSNCGQYVSTMRKADQEHDSAYSYKIKSV